MKTIKERDSSIDIFRSLAMILVIVVHCLFWTNVYKSGLAYIIKSFFLIEMPIFFVITGASNYLSKKRVAEFYVSRFQRIMIPYWIYAIICIIVTLLIISINNYSQIDSLVINWLLPIDRQETCLEFLTWALWFIPIYILVVMVFPFLKLYFNIIKNSLAKIIPLILFSIIILLMDLFKLSNTNFSYYARMLVFYSFWVYLGMFYITKKSQFNKKNSFVFVFIFIVCITICVLLGLTPYYTFNMQINKFPPNFMFLVYTFGILSLVYYLSNYIVKFYNIISKNSIINWILKQYKDSGYVIYLFHPFVFLIIKKLLSGLNINNFINNNDLLTFLIYLILIIPLCALLGKLLGWIEKIKVLKKF